MAALSRRALLRISATHRSLISISTPSPILSLQLAHFSTNSNQPSYASARHEEQARNVGVSVWWDFENCDLPTGTNVYNVSKGITDAIRANGIMGPVQISAYGNVLKLPKLTQEALACTGISLNHVPTGGKSSVEKFLMMDLLYWVSQHPPPAHLFFISGDDDMASILHRLRMSNYNILLASPEDASTALCSAASIMWQWDDLARGEDLAGRHFNQPPDGLDGSWYGAYRFPLETSFLSVEQSVPYQVRASVESGPIVTRGTIPAEVATKIHEIVSSYPNGIVISMLRKELSSTMALDTNLYGYKKFSSFLSAMPDLFKLRLLKNGQLSVCAISAEAPVLAGAHTKASESSNGRSIGHRTQSTQMKFCDDGSISIKSTDMKAAPDLTLTADEKKSALSKLHESCVANSVQHRSPSDRVKESSLKGECEVLPTNGKDTEGTPVNLLTVTEKQDVAYLDVFFKATWKRLFGGTVMQTEQSNTTKSSPVPLSSPSCEITSMTKPVINDGEGGKNKSLFRRVIGWFKIDGKPEAGVSFGELSTISNQESSHDPFSKDCFWAEMEVFLGTAHGIDAVAKSSSRLKMAQNIKKNGPLALRSYDDHDIVNLVNVLIEEKRWIQECPSGSSPFKIVCTTGKNFSLKPGDSTDVGCVSPTKLLQSDQPKHPENSKEMKVARVPSINKKHLEWSKSEMLRDCQQLLDEIMMKQPRGFSITEFSKLFLKRYHYCLDLQRLGYRELASLIQEMHGVTLKGTRIVTSEDASGRIDNELLGTSTNFDNSDSLYEEELGPVRDSDRIVPSRLHSNAKQNIERKVHAYQPSSLEDAYSESDEETPAGKEPQKAEISRLDRENSALLDILGSWHDSKHDPAKKNSSISDALSGKPHFPAEFRRDSSGMVAKRRSPKIIEFVSEVSDRSKEQVTVFPDHKKSKAEMPPML